MKEHEFQVTESENDREVSVYITEYDGDKIIRHDVEKPSIRDDEETLAKIKGYLSLYSIADDKLTDAINAVLEKLQFHDWFIAAKAMAEAMNSEINHSEVK